MLLKKQTNKLDILIQINNIDNILLYNCIKTQRKINAITVRSFASNNRFGQCKSRRTIATFSDQTNTLLILIRKLPNKIGIRHVTSLKFSSIYTNLE